MIAQKIANGFRTARDRGPMTLAKAVGRLTLATAQHKLLGRRFQTRRVHDYRMLLDMEDAGLSRSLLLFRTREVDHKLMLERIVRPGMTVFDIGGNIGYYPLMEFSLLRGTGRVVVVEPSPANIELLRRNLALNGHGEVAIVAAAVSDQPGERVFYLSEQSNLGTFHPLGSGSETLTGETVDVETVTVPMLADRFGPPDLIRMDVEGHEVEVLNGMLDDLKARRYAPLVIFETHLTRYGAEHDMAATLEALFSLGYTVPLVSSSTDSAAARLKAMGYSPGPRIPTDGIHRTLFADIRPEDIVRVVTRTGGARTVVLAPGGSVAPQSSSKAFL